ncbi:MAG: nucleotide pyrophosphohydrolase [Thermoplasmata archaeon]|nr:nucleotide pyrophosphohydrolase [Thermoplasmata archaeon]
MDIRAAQKMVDERFGEIDRRSGILFLTSVLAEETGEVAKAARGRGDLGEELADVLFVVLGMANVGGIDLERRFREKYVNRSPEEISRTWTDLPG